MKTPNLDREIETYEIHKKQGYLTKDGENYLAEFKAIKQALIIADVSQCNEQLMAMLTSRVLTIQNEPDGIVRETMINNLLIDINCG